VISPHRCCHCLTDGETNAVGLCANCARHWRIRILYKTRPDRPSWWPEHLEALAERARQQLPLFPSNQESQ
jgi:hypothetical protein